MPRLPSYQAMTVIRSVFEVAQQLFDVCFRSRQWSAGKSARAICHCRALLRLRIAWHSRISPTKKNLRLLCICLMSASTILPQFASIGADQIAAMCSATAGKMIRSLEEERSGSGSGAGSRHGPPSPSPRSPWPRSCLSSCSSPSRPSSSSPDT